MFIFYSIIYNEKREDVRFYTFYIVVPILCYTFIQSVIHNNQIQPYVFGF